MSDLDDFLTVTLARHAKATDLSHNGDPTLYLQEWSTREPVTVFGARESVVGWEAASQAIGAVVARFSNASPLDFELLAAGIGGELAYLVGYEHAALSVDNGPVQPSTLRVTHVYRREDGDWKLVHRHADRATIDQPAPTEAPGT